MNSFWTYLYRNSGLSLKYSRHYLAPAYKGSGIAQIEFDTSLIIQEDWIKRKTLEVISEFLLDVYQFNIQRNDDEFILHRVVTNPTNLEHSPEDYLLKLTISDDKCRIIITDLIPEKNIEAKTSKDYDDIIKK
jgi:hypothetical protein